MKNKVIVLLSVAVIVGAGIGSATTYEHYTHWSNLQHAKASAISFAEQQAAKHKAAKQAAQLNALKNQCAKDHQLFVDSKGKSPNGDCDTSLQIVQ